MNWMELFTSPCTMDTSICESRGYLPMQRRSRFCGPLPPPRPLRTSLSSTQLSSDASGSSGLQQTSPNWRSVISPTRLPTFNLKVVKADMKKIGKAFTPISQTFIELIDSTANLENITGIIGGQIMCS